MFRPADHKNTRIAKGEELRLRYRVLDFSGNAESAGIAQKFTEFAAGSSKP